MKHSIDKKTVKNLFAQIFSSYILLRKYLTNPITSPTALVYASFIVSLLLTGFFMAYNNYQDEISRQQKYNAYFLELRLKIRERSVLYLNLSKSIAGLFVANQTVTLAMWNDYINSILNKNSYPGIMGLSFVAWVADSEKKQFFYDMNSAYPHLNFHYDDQYPEKVIVKYVLPEQYHTAELNSFKAIGVNLFAQPDIMATLNHARQVNYESLMPGTKIIVSDVVKNKPAIIIFTPIYKTVFSELEHGYSKSFLGWISAPIAVKKFFEDLITPKMRVIVHDQDVVIFDSNPNFKTVGISYRNFNFDFAERNWLIDIYFANDNQHPFYFSNSTIVGGCGFILSLLLAGFLWALTINKKRAQALADKISLNLENTQSRHRTLLENIPGAVFQCIPGQNWHMEYISNYIEKLTGYEAADFINGRRCLSEIVYPRDLPFVKNIIGTTPVPDHSYYIEYRIVHQDGKIRWLYERGIVIKDAVLNNHYLTGAIFDITDHKCKDKDVQRLTMALQNTVEGIVFIDPSLRYLNINQSFATMIGCQDHRLINRYWLDNIHIDDQQKILNGLSNLVVDTKFTTTVRGLQIDGTLIHQYIVIVGTYNDDGRLEGYYCFIHDITQSKREEEALSIAVHEAQRANNMKSEFLATVSHELRTPLNAIIGYSEMLIEEIENADTQSMSNDLHKIMAAGKHLLHLINDILDISKLEAGKMTVHLETLSIQPMLQSIIDIVRPGCLQNNNQIDYYCDPEIGSMYSDFTKIRQSLLNILSNATKFTKNGKIDITVVPIMKNNHEHIIFSISDTGVGITEEQIKKLFKAFTQADSSTTRQFGGTGLGLAISKQFCEMLGGTIDVTSVPHQGSTFTIRLPRNASNR